MPPTGVRDLEPHLQLMLIRRPADDVHLEPPPAGGVGAKPDDDEGSVLQLETELAKIGVYALAHGQSRTRAWNRVRSSRVTGPSLPEPTTRPSTSRIEITSAAVPVKKASSAVYTS